MELGNFLSLLSLTILPLEKTEDVPTSAFRFVSFKGSYAPCSN